MTRQSVLHCGLLAVLLVPLIFGKTLLYPFIVHRTFFFFFLVDVLFILFLLEERMAWVRPLARNTVGRAALLFFAAKLFTDLLGIHPWPSIWGNYERMMGFATHAHLLLFFIMAVMVFREERAYRKFFDALAAVAGLVSLYGILHPYAIDERLFSTVGNPAFLAGFLLFAVFVCGFRAYETRGQRAFFLFVASGALSLIALYLTATRGAFVGLAAGAGVLGFWIAMRKRPLRAPALILVLVLLLVFVGLRAFRGSAFVEGQTTLRRLASLSFSDFSVRERLLAWSTAWEGIKERPIRGFGEYMIVDPLDRRMRPDILGIWYDSSHNAALDLLLAHGLIGLAAFVFLFASVFWTLRKKREDSPVAAMCCSAALVAYLVQSLFMFDTLVVLIPLWIVIGFAALPLDDQKESPARSGRVFAWLGIACIACLLLSFIRPLRALAALSSGKRIMEAGDVLGAAEAFDRSVNLATFGWGNIAAIIRDAAIAHPSAFPALEPALEAAYARARASEGDLTSYTGDLAQVYLATPASLRPAYVAKAEALLNAAIERSPGRVDLYFAKAQALYDQGKITESVTLLKEIHDRFPVHAARAEGVLNQMERLIDAR